MNELVSVVSYNENLSIEIIHYHTAKLQMRGDLAMDQKILLSR